MYENLFSQIRSQAAPIARPQAQASVQIRPTQNSTVRASAQKVQPTSLSNSIQVTTTSNSKTQASTGAQLKQIITNNNVNINNNNNTKNNNNNKNQISIAVVSTINNSTQVANNSKSSTTPSPNNSKSPTKSNSAISNSHSSTTPTTFSTSTKSPTFNNKTHHETVATTKKSQGSTIKAKDKKTSLASVVAASSGIGSNAMSSSFYPSTFGDDDINDVAAMGGVNLAEESQRILGSTEYVGTQIRSCKDEILLNLPILQQRIRQQMARHGLDEPSTDVAVLISHATQEHLKNVTEKLAVIAEHRIDILKVHTNIYFILSLIIIKKNTIKIY